MTYSIRHGDGGQHLLHMSSRDDELHLRERWQARITVCEQLRFDRDAVVFALTVLGLEQREPRPEVVRP